MTGFSGAPAWRWLKNGVQSTSNPQLAGCSGAMSMPRAASVPVQAPSEPSSGQLPPPSASTVASARAIVSPSGVAKRNAPSASQPSQRCWTWNCTPLSLSRRTQPRNSGAALRSTGNTRPELPT
jgi:hypothetical protein